MFNDEYIQLELISARLNLPEKYLKELVEDGKIPYLAVGKRKRFQEQAVRAALNDIEQAELARQQNGGKQSRLDSLIQGVSKIYSAESLLVSAGARVVYGDSDG